MGTKRNPGKYDCYAAAEPDEPLFVLMGRDPIASLLVRLWADLKELLDATHATDHKHPKAQEALLCADAMDRWLYDSDTDLPKTRQRLVRLLFQGYIRRAAKRFHEVVDNAR